MRFLATVMATLSLAIAGASMAPAQGDMTRLFRLEAGGTPAWFTADDATRGMAVVPGGSVLVADRNPATTIHRLDPATGGVRGQLNTGAISGGTFPINVLAVAEDGQIYVSNLVTAGQNLRVYRFASEAADPVLVYEETGVAARWGDQIAVGGVGSRTRIAITGSDNPSVMVLTDPTGTGRLVARQVTMTEPALTGVNHIAFDPRRHDRVWMRQATAASTLVVEYDILTGRGTGNRISPATNQGPIAMARAADGGTLGIVGPGYVQAGNNGLRGHVVRTSSAAVLARTGEGLERTGGAAVNTNGAGAIGIDSRSGRVYFLLANNTITGWQMPTGLLAPALGPRMLGGS